jgi:hypothetical protein
MIPEGRLEISMSRLRLLLLRARAKFLSDHRLVFEQAANEVRDESSASLCVIEHKDWSSIPPEFRSTLVAHTRQLQWDLQDTVESGGTLWLGLEHGLIEGFAITRRGDQLERYFFPLNADCIVISHCMTLQAFRGRGIYPALLQSILLRLSTSCDRFYIDCTDYREASARGITKAGFHFIGRGICHRNGRLEWKSSNVLPRLSLA